MFRDINALKAGPIKYREAKTSIRSSCNFQPHFQTVKCLRSEFYDDGVGIHRTFDQHFFWLHLLVETFFATNQIKGCLLT